MTFLAILIGYVLRRMLDASERVSSDRFFRNRLSQVPTGRPGREGRTGVGIALLAALVAVATAIEWAFSTMTLPILQWPLDVLLLTLLLGQPGWKRSLTGYGEAWRRGDSQAAWMHVCDLLPPDSRGLALNPALMHRELCREFIRQIFHRYFLLIFWFALLGLPGLVLSRVALALKDHWPHASARETYQNLVWVLEWIPARALALSFAVAGDLAGWVKHRRRGLFRFGEQTDGLLFHSANGALSSYSLDPDRYEQEHPERWPDYGPRSLLAVRELLNRSMLVWISALALLAIGGLL